MFPRSYQCPDCGSVDAYRSRPKTLFERYLLPLLCLRPVRCANCFRRNFASTFVPVRERRDRSSAMTGAAA